MDQDQVETSGKTVEDALDVALKQLRATKDDVEFTVLDEGKRGFFFGAGGRDARVSVRRVAGASSNETKAADPGPPRDRSTGAVTDEPKAGSSSRRRRGGRDQDKRGGRREPRGSSSRRYEDPVPGLSATDFLPREERAAGSGDDETGSQAPSTPQPAGQGSQGSQGDQGGRNRRGGRGGNRSGGDRERRPRERRQQEATNVEPNIDHEVVDVAATVVDDVLRMLKLDTSISLREPVTPGDGLGSALAVIDISGDDLGALIGRRGETLLNLQYLVNLIIARRYPNEGGVTIDIEHYRHRREEQIVDLATRMAERVRENGSPITLEPMSAADRRIVHLTLAEDPELETHSTGDGEDRKVVISTRQ